ncbi:MAG: hypothetical protein Ct9H90mP27_4220 [Gammaproteobacteria bacterium]|nr:MAG: hypothetical protein Ct9H90mP27_4220 [Gammaproteobacteria bacterium]
MRPERKKNRESFLMLDIGGSMDAHVKICEECFLQREPNSNIWKASISIILFMNRAGRIIVERVARGAYL